MTSVRLRPQAGVDLGELCDIPGLRSRRVTEFPCGWFYVIGSDHIDVVRLLDDAQDLPALLADPSRRRR